jgi:hypothetical protein
MSRLLPAGCGGRAFCLTSLFSVGLKKLEHVPDFWPAVAAGFGAGAGGVLFFALLVEFEAFAVAEDDEAADALDLDASFDDEVCALVADSSLFSWRSLLAVVCEEGAEVLSGMERLEGVCTTIHASSLSSFSDALSLEKPFLDRLTTLAFLLALESDDDFGESLAEVGGRSGVPLEGGNLVPSSSHIMISSSLESILLLATSALSTGPAFWALGCDCAGALEKKLRIVAFGAAGRGAAVAFLVLPALLAASVPGPAISTWKRANSHSFTRFSQSKRGTTPGQCSVGLFHQNVPLCDLLG